MRDGTRFFLFQIRGISHYFGAFKTGIFLNLLNDLANTKKIVPVSVGDKRWILTEPLRGSVSIHRYSPPFRGIIVNYPYLARAFWARLALQVADAGC